MKQKRLLPWYGSNTENAPTVGSLLKGRRWVGIPFGGGMSEVPFIDALSIVVNDKHRHVINLCRVLQSQRDKENLVQRLNLTPFHPDALKESQELAKIAANELSEGLCDWMAACAYFVSQWMGRSGNAGKEDEFKGKLSTRANANGGDSNKRFRSATDSLEEWSAVMRRCNFSCLDWEEWAAQYDGDTDDHGHYLDAPWVEEGEAYLHKFEEADHRRLATWAGGFKHARVVVRYGDHPLVRELYDGWTFHESPSRNQGNNAVREVLITNFDVAL